MKIEEMKELIQMVADAKVDEFEFQDDDYFIRIAKNEPQIIASQAAPMAMAPQMAAPAAQAPAGEAAEAKVEGNEVKAPLVGTFYAAPSEGADPFVSVGDKVKKGQVIGIVEAMKLMNEVESEFDGTVVAVNVENGEMVEYGQTLIVVGQKGLPYDNGY